MLIKDPTNRISLNDAKFFPWVIEDLSKSEKEAWLSTADPPVLRSTKAEINKVVSLKVINKINFRI